MVGEPATRATALRGDRHRAHASTTTIAARKPSSRIQPARERPRIIPRPGSRVPSVVHFTIEGNASPSLREWRGRSSSPAEAVRAAAPAADAEVDEGVADARVEPAAGAAGDVGASGAAGVAGGGFLLPLSWARASRRARREVKTCAAGSPLSAVSPVVAGAPVAAGALGWTVAPESPAV